MINRILHLWSVNVKFMKLVVLFRYFARRRLAKYRNYTTRFINFILNDHLGKILYIWQNLMCLIIVTEDLLSKVCKSYALY